MSRTYTLRAFGSGGEFLRESTATIEDSKGTPIGDLCAACTQGFEVIPDAQTITVYTPAGSFVMAAHRDDPKPAIFSVATGWWQLPQNARHDDHTAAYTARKAVDEWLDPILRERAAMDRLEAALARLT